MNPTAAILVVSGSLALIAGLFLFLRLRELQRIRSVTEELKASDRQFSAQLSRIEEIIGRLDDDRTDPVHPEEATEWSQDPRQGEWVTDVYMHHFSYSAHRDEDPSEMYLRRKIRAVDHASGRTAEAHWQTEDRIPA